MEKHEFDQFAHNYRTTHSQALSITGETSEFFAAYKAQKLQAWLPEFYTGIPETLLDFGCGDGMMTSKIKNYFPQTKLFGVDPSSESIALAQQNHSGITFKVSDNTIPFKPCSFDVVYAAGVFHHIPFDLHQHFIKEVVRVLKPNGIFVIFELNPYNPGTRYIFKHAPMDVNATMLKPYYAASLLNPYGKTATKYYGFFPHPLRALRFTEKFLTALPLGGLYATFLKKSA